MYQTSLEWSIHDIITVLNPLSPKYYFRVGCSISGICAFAINDRAYIKIIRGDFLMRKRAEPQ